MLELLSSVEIHRKKFIKILFPWLTLLLKKIVINSKTADFIEKVHSLSAMSKSTEIFGKMSLFQKVLIFMASSLY